MCQVMLLRLGPAYLLISSYIYKKSLDLFYLPPSALHHPLLILNLGLLLSIKEKNLT